MSNIPTHKNMIKELIQFIFIFFCSTALSANNFVVTKLNGYDPNITDNSDLVYFDKIIESAKVLGLGESTHGTKEFFQMKHRLFKYLVEHQGFTIFAMEQDMALASQLNDYVLRGMGDPKKILIQMNPPYACEEVLELINWMRDYNKTAQIKVRFYGIDIQDFTAPASIALNLINQSGDDELKNIIKDIHGKIPILEKEFYDILIEASSGQPSEKLKLRAKIFINEEAKLKFEINKLLVEVIIHKNSLEQKIGLDNYQWLIQNLHLCQQKSDFTSLTMSDLILHERRTIQSFNFHDLMMARNVKWIVEQNPNSKIVIWAHDGHIQSIPQTIKPNVVIAMGVHLKQFFKNQYRAIDFITYDGTYTAISDKGTIGLFNLQIPLDHTLEFMVNNIAFPKALLNIRDKENVPDFLVNKINFRSIGWEEDPDQFQEQLANISLAFDGIIYLRDTEGSHVWCQPSLLLRLGKPCQAEAIAKA